MIFEEIKIPETPAERRTKKAWVDIGVKYMSAKKKNPALSTKDFSSELGIKQETFTRAMRRYKDDIKAFYSALNPNKTKEQWIELGIKYLDAKSKGFTLGQFADEYNLNKETAARAFRRFRSDIIIQNKLNQALKDKRKLTAKEKYDLLLRDFRARTKEKTRDSVVKNQQKSTEWFSKIIKQNVYGYKPNKPSIGKLYTYVYDAKHKATLPYWDVYPLIIYLGESIKHRGLMLGLNLHYIPPKARQEFLEELLKYASTDRITNKTALKINWNKVKSMKGVDLMVKSYIPNRIKGGMIEVKPHDWSNVIYLPTQKFVTGLDNKPHSVSKIWKKF